jgi:rhamnogalacturonyl hydrolase YesR
MKTVPREFVVEAWERQCGLLEGPTRDLMRQFMDEQPAVGIFLTVGDEQLGDEAEESQLIPLASAVWEAMTRMRGRRLKMVRPEVVEHADQANTRMLQELEEASEFEWRESVTKMFLGHNQQPLLAFCIEILMARDEAEPEFAPQRIGMELVWLKTVVECFDQ